MSLLRFSAIILTILMLSSCQKQDSPIALPPNDGESKNETVDLGSGYTDQVFFNLESDRVVMTSQVVSWDIAFEASADGYHIFMNGGKEGSVYNTHQNDIAEITNIPKLKTEDWIVDAPEGLPDSTAVGEWVDGSKNSKNEVYILKYNASMVPDTFKKIKLISVSKQAYTMQYSTMRSKEIKTITIPKDDNYSFVYFSFDNNGQIVKPEPPKGTWDFVFTRYRHVYRELNNFPYVVTGALLSPDNTYAYDETEIPFDQIDKNNIKEGKFTNFRDVIGFDWKSYDIDKGKYTVNSSKSFVIKTAKGQVYKLHFLGYLSPTGLPGTPSFEFKRIL